MKFQRRIGVVLAWIVLLYMCAIVALVFYLQAHPGSIPRWIPISMLCFFVATVVVGSVVIRRTARKLEKGETTEEAKQRRAVATKGLKAGLVLYILILLNGIALILQREIPLNYAIPGLAIDMFLIAVFWISLRRLKKVDVNDQATRQQLPQK
jgi:peptidoglycan/LPS O-acetylase OafA/YrhL